MAFHLAGADLNELRDLSTTEAHRTQYLKDLSDGITSTRKPVIACIESFAVSHVVCAALDMLKYQQLGGGFELALMVSNKFEKAEEKNACYYVCLQ